MWTRSFPVQVALLSAVCCLSACDLQFKSKKDQRLYDNSHACLNLLRAGHVHAADASVCDVDDVRRNLRELYRRYRVEALFTEWTEAVEICFQPEHLKANGESPCRETELFADLLRDSCTDAHAATLLRQTLTWYVETPKHTVPGLLIWLTEPGEGISANLHDEKLREPLEARLREVFLFWFNQTIPHVLQIDRARFRNLPARWATLAHIEFTSHFLWELDFAGDFGERFKALDPGMVRSLREHLADAKFVGFVQQEEWHHGISFWRYEYQEASQLYEQLGETEHAQEALRHLGYQYLMQFSLGSPGEELGNFQSDPSWSPYPLEDAVDCLRRGGEESQNVHEALELARWYAQDNGYEAEALIALTLQQGL